MGAGFGPDDVTNNVVDIVVDNVVDIVVDIVVDKRLKTILSLLKENNKLSALELSVHLGVSSRTIQRDIDKLKEYGSIERIGNEKSGSWKITNN